MRKWLTVFICTCLLVMMSGCISKNPSTNGKIKVDVFVLNTCSMCKAFKQYGIPALEAEFGDQIEINLLDIEEGDNGALYDQKTSELVDYDSTYSRMVPFIVVEDYFAVLAYNSGEETALISDIKAAIDGKPLGDTLSKGRWLFKK